MTGHVVLEIFNTVKWTGWFELRIFYLSFQKQQKLGGFMADVSRQEGPEFKYQCCYQFDQMSEKPLG